MPSLKTALKENKPEEMIKVVVLRTIGIDASPEMIARLKTRAKEQKIPFSSAGLTEMVTKGNEVEIPKSAAKKLSEAGAVRISI